ncbi:hypothetical protein HXA31_15405 [Salipaludibacillus agaradhaerens]|uniref:Uncharacterized protein n=1 Tax=Salipaludibacillus agaradhaerens TaxID=76935 RepID=A0A9Q4G1D6_SALAG|nr:hypothetical protein [Salipaludibacillus agaradhaerens]MCR6098749.1 hypothetical protein [Salipaludibacillus agaradhaerens]MCR6115756.1 hypothetical protein [Salipaludibacillus agaradhaerens]
MVVDELDQTIDLIFNKALIKDDGGTIVDIDLNIIEKELGYVSKEYKELREDSTTWQKFTQFSNKIDQTPSAPPINIGVSKAHKASSVIPFHD